MTSEQNILFTTSYNGTNNCTKLHSIPFNYFSTSVANLHMINFVLFSIINLILMELSGRKLYVD